MIEYLININFKKFASSLNEVRFLEGINVIYGESGVGKSVFLSCLENPQHNHDCNFDIEVITRCKSIYRIVQNPDLQILTRTVQNEIIFTPECEGLKPDQLEKFLKAGLKKLPTAAPLLI